MHRSGTSLVAKVLEKAGIFMGVVKDHNYEAMHFLSLNQQSLWAAGANWLDPKVPAPEYWKTLPKEILFYEHFKIYSRIQKILLRLRSPRWGWKDPRNTFTLPMWLALYPEAKVLHITRNTEEIIKSLATRNRVLGEVHDPRLDDEAFNHTLSQKYLEQARSYAITLGSQYHEIDYAEILNLSQEKIGALEKFTGVRLFSLFKEYVRQ